MCGILGVVGDSANVDLDVVSSSLASLQHRGPDARGYRLLTGGGVSCALGHTRLRIIDLSPEADQPLSNEDATVWVSYNGELYNHLELRRELQDAGHTFRSRSDTEVLVHLYEDARGNAEAMLARLRGMFAFAIFDASNGRVLLARDRVGIKPLYWTPTGGGIAFASEVRALIDAGFAGTDPDPQALMSYLMWGVVPGPAAIVAGVREVAPGSLVEWDSRGARERVWWRPTIDASGSEGDRDLALALRDSMRRHLIADRPVGVFLSSGLDSSVIASLASAEGEVRALTVTFPDGPQGGVDEGLEAAEFARAIGAKHEMVAVSGKEVADLLPELFRGMDRPTSDGVNTWLVSRAAKEAGLVVVLSGLGGDELFGGYPSFQTVPQVESIRRAMRVLPSGAWSSMARVAGRRTPGGRVARILGASGGSVGAYTAVRGLFSPAEVRVMTGSRNGELIRMPDAPAAGVAQDRVTLLEMTWYMPNQLLLDTDQMSMRHSLEVRVPLLDDDVVRAALRIPAAARVAQGKEFLARAAGLESRPKRPFTLPFDHWLRGPLRETLREGLLSEDLPLRDLVTAPARRLLLERFEADRVHWSRPWAVAAIRHWARARGFTW